MVGPNGAPQHDTTTDPVGVTPPGGSPISGAFIGGFIGPYQLQRRIGVGGMGTVWLARDDRHARDVALKLLDERFTSANDEAHGPRARFLAEARAAARLDHPHVATLFDAGETNEGRLYIAMAYCEGGSLAERLARGPLPVAEALQVARQLALALGAVHEAGIVHRDVKPANVLFDASGAVRLTDFGIARVDDVGVTRTGVVLGTPAYLAPEQVRGERADSRADLWALGISLYEMLTGRRPFDGDSFVAVAQQVLLDAPAPLPVSLEAPPALHLLIDRLLAKEPADRVPSTDSVLRTIDELLQPANPGGATPVGDAPLSPTPSPSASPSAVDGTPANALTSLIGRERELAQCAGLLRQARLITLTGVGGTGKTRLAMELARRVAAAYPDGVHSVLLSSTARADQVPAAIAESIGLRESGTVCMADQTIRHFAAKRALLVLDNFEHLLDAADFVARLLVAAPQLTVLVTSRAPLRLSGEQEVPVPPLALPDADAGVARIADAESTRLFVQRARASRPSFSLTDTNAGEIAAICRRLDGLPLAIELAAARVKLLAPRAILSRLEHRFDLLRSDARDIDPRHRTLRDVIDWSFELLTEAEQALFAELSVFAGGFSLDAASAVASVDAPEGELLDGLDVLDRVSSLCDKSLVTQREGTDHEPRFGMLETVREYGRDHLRASGKVDAVRSAHLAHFLSFAEECAPHLRGPDQAAWFDRLAQEHDNLRAALDHAIDSGNVLAAASLGVALHRFWLTRGYLGEGTQRLAAIDALVQAGDVTTVPLQMQATIKTALGLLTGVRSELAASMAHFECAHRLFEQAGDEEGAAVALNHRGWLAYLLGRVEESTELSARALAYHERSGNRLGVANANSNLGWVATTRGPLAEAEQRFERALAIHRERRDLRAIAYGLTNVGGVRQQRADYAGAMSHYNDAMVIARSLGDRMLDGVLRTRSIAALHETGADGDIDTLENDVVPSLRQIGHRWTLATTLATLGVLLRDTGKLHEARAVAQESLALRREMQDVTRASESEALLGSIAHRLGELELARTLFTSSLEEAFARQETFGVLLCLEGFALMARDGGDDAASVRLSAGVAQQRINLQMPLPPRYARHHDAALGAMESKVGVANFVEAWSIGQRATLAQLVAWTGEMFFDRP